MPLRNQEHKPGESSDQGELQGKIKRSRTKFVDQNFDRRRRCKYVANNGDYPLCHASIAIMSGGVLLLRGGHVIDPANEIDKEPYDVLLDGRKVLDVGEDIQLPEGGQVFNASGYLVCPGLVDLHVHCFPGGTLLGVDPDEWCLKRGVTTVVDAGSAGT